LLFFFAKISDNFLHQVPVVVIFTKFDAIEDICYGKLRGQGKSHDEASLQLPELANKIFQQEYLPHILDAAFPPKTYICVAGNVLYSYRVSKFSWIVGLDKEENQCSELSEKTADILDDNVLINLFVSTQKNNLDLCIKKGIRLVFYLFFILKYLLRTYRNIWKYGSYLLFFER